MTENVTNNSGNFSSAGGMQFGASSTYTQAASLGPDLDPAEVASLQGELARLREMLQERVDSGDEHQSVRAALAQTTAAQSLTDSTPHRNTLTTLLTGIAASIKDIDVISTFAVGLAHRLAGSA
jgi:uncharacterized phage infection (PIP) family protein YhgE